MRTNLALLALLIAPSTFIGSAAGSQAQSGCYNHHCLQYLSGGSCFIPNTSPPTPPSCFDLDLELVLKTHVESKNHTPANAYWNLADATYLGDVFTYHVNTKVALCHTGYLFLTKRYYSICRMTVRDNDWADAEDQPSCSMVHDNGESFQRSGCITPPVSYARISVLEAILAFIAITTAPVAYSKTYDKVWRSFSEETGVAYRLLRSAHQFGVVFAGCIRAFFNPVAEAVDPFVGVMQEFFNLNTIVGVVAALGNPPRA